MILRPCPTVPVSTIATPGQPQSSLPNGSRPTTVGAPPDPGCPVPLIVIARKPPDGADPGADAAKVAAESEENLSSDIGK
jgi:hypothetical protein